MVRSMDKNKAPAFVGGFIFSTSPFFGSTYVETGIKGLIGGVFGLLGKLLISWIFKKL